MKIKNSILATTAVGCILASIIFVQCSCVATLMNVISHYYNSCKELKLTEAEKSDLVEYLKSL